MAFQKAAEKAADPARDWETVGWINSTSKGSYTVKDKDNQLVGFVSKVKLEALVKGTARGAAISIPKKA